jgi:hypothetical protein
MAELGLDRPERAALVLFQKFEVTALAAISR